MPCRGICDRYRAKQLPHFKKFENDKIKGSSGRYINGQKRCQRCELFIIYDSYNCPCCGSKLRTKPRPGKLKNIYTSLKNKELELVKK